MRIVVVVGEERWVLGHGRDPADLLAEHGWAGRPVRAELGESDVELHYAVTPLEVAATPVDPESGCRGGRVLQRLAAYALVVDDGHLLMTQLSDRVRGVAAGMWTLPGGGVYPGEAPVDGVVREVHEETGQHVVVDDLVQVQSQHRVEEEVGVDGHEDFHAVRLVYRAHAPAPTAARVVEVAGSTGAAAWVPLGEVSRLSTVGMVATARPHVTG